MPRQIEVLIEDEKLELDPGSVEKLLHFLDTEVSDWKVPPGDLTVAFVTTERCQELHSAFFQDATVTDVMTFPGEAEDDYAGDLAICPAYAQLQSPAFGTDFSTELQLYLLHGWLHLAGLNDRTEKQRTVMRQAEKTLQAITEKFGYRLSAVYNN